VALAAAFAVSCLLSLVLMPLGIRLAWATGYLDHPEARKLHTSATALLGGAVVFLAAVAGWAIAYVTSHPGLHREALLLLSGSLLVLGLGLGDDRFGMRPALKLLGQSAAGVLLLAGCGVPALGFGAPLDAALTLLALVALMNAVNFLDNMNGVVAGLAAIAFAGFAWTSAARGAFGLAAAQLALAGACLGFLRYNFPRARVFLGDAGSLFLGYSLGASAVLAYMGAPHGWGRLGPLLLLAYPAFDMIFVVVNRLREGRKIYAGGKDHSNHRVARLIQCQTTTVLLLWANGAALCASGVAVLHLNRPGPTLLAWGLWTTLYLLVGLRLSFEPSARSGSTQTPLTSARSARTASAPPSARSGSTQTPLTSARSARTASAPPSARPSGPHPSEARPATRI